MKVSNFFPVQLYGGADQSLNTGVADTIAHSCSWRKLIVLKKMSFLNILSRVVGCVEIFLNDPFIEGIDTAVLTNRVFQKRLDTNFDYFIRSKCFDQPK